MRLRYRVSEETGPRYTGTDGIRTHGDTVVIAGEANKKPLRPLPAP